MLTPLIVLLVKFIKLSVGEALEWLFFSTLSSFCFSIALQDLHRKHQQSSICTGLDDVDRAMYCEMIERNNQTSDCCPGKLPDSSVCRFRSTPSSRPNNIGGSEMSIRSYVGLRPYVHASTKSFFPISVKFGM